MSLQESFATLTSLDSWGNYDGIHRAFSFIPTNTHSCTSVALYGYRIGGAVAVSTFTIAICPVVSARPAVSIAYDTATLVGTAVNTIVASATSSSWIGVAFSSPVPLTSGVEYAFYYKCIGTVTNNVYTMFDTWASYTVSWVNQQSLATTIATPAISDWASAGGRLDSQYFQEWGIPTAPAPTSQWGTLSRKKKLVAFGDGKVYFAESNASTLAEITAGRDSYNPNKGLAAVEAFEKIFVANNSVFKVLDFTNVKLSTANIGTANSVAPDHNNILTGGTSSAQMAVDYITSLVSASIIYGKKWTTASFTSAETVTGTNDLEQSVSFVLNDVQVTAVHCYDWGVYGGSTTYGTMPERAVLACLYRGRVVVAGNEVYPHQWYMFRQTNPFDCNYVANDAQSPVAGQDADAGKIGDIVTSLIPRKDDYLIIGCNNSIWVIRGDPASGGTLDVVDLSTGIFGAKSWCWDSEDNLFFWGSNGIYVLPASESGIGKPENLTKNLVPDIVAEASADPAVHRITMAFDRSRHGLNIFVTNNTTGSNSDYWFDLRTKGFFPESYPAAAGGFSAFFFEADSPTYRQLLVGSNDGYIRKFSDTAKDDDVGTTDTAISAYVVLGPNVLASDPHKESRITDSTVIAAGGASGGTFGDTDGFTLSFYKGKDAETVQEDIEDAATAFYTVAVTGTGRKTRIRTKISGNALAVKIHTTASTQTWGFEKFIANFKEIGRVR